ncbi:MAG: C25 family cysteine peptidase [bacterium]
MRKVRWWVLIFFLCSLTRLFGKTPTEWQTFQLLEVASNHLIFELKSFELAVTPLKIGDQLYQQMAIAGFGVNSRPGYPQVPAAGVLIPLPESGQVRVAVLASEFEDRADVLLAPVPALLEAPGGEHSASYQLDTAVYQANAFWPANIVELTDRARLRGQLIGRIQVNPVQYHPVNKILRVYHTLKIRVSFAEPLKTVSPEQGTLFDDLRRRLLLAPQLRVTHTTEDENVKSQLKTNDWYNPQFRYFKLLVSEEGLYELSYDDLVQAGVPVAQLEVSRLKMYNQGQQIPVWISGPTDGSFTPANRLYFYGDWHRGTERYFDFYTDTNVYWLTADGAPGERYRLMQNSEPAGSPEEHYWQTLHLEQERILHQSNKSSARDADEGWIWRYFFDDDKEVMDFEVNALTTAPPLCSLTVRLHGTTKDPVNPDHHVRLSVNDQLIGEAFFDEQNEFLWRLTFSTALLKEGRNHIELHLVPDTGAQLNQIFLDWLELAYPRLHAAQNRALQFVPSSDRATHQSFSLVNFPDDEILVLNPTQKKMWQPPAQRASFYQVDAAGTDDGNFVKMQVDFENFTFQSRGHNLLVIYPDSAVTKARSFDTFGSGSGADDMADFIDGLPDSTVVLVGIFDEGSANMTERAYQALESLGSALTRQVGFRDSWAMIGWKGARIGSVKEALSRRFSGPVSVVDTLTGALASRYRVAFEDTLSSSTFYLAASASGFKKVLKIEPEQTSHWRSENHGADYLIIAHRNFLQEAQELANYRSELNGFRSTVVEVQDVYDEFNAGIMSPTAIKDFIAYAYANWQKPAPSYVVLFGDASWDPKQHLPEATKINFVPSYGLLVADNWYATLDGPEDILPDLFVGRIPVENTEQAASVVEKIRAYESLPYDSWSKEFAFLSGGINSTEQSIFLSQTNNLISSRIETPPLHGRAFRFNKTTNEAITQSLRRILRDKIHAGVLWVNFLGHAGSTVWDIDIGGPEDWQNQTTFPFMTGMSCHSARFANPTINSLSEEFVLHEMGASAYWGSTGFGYITQDFFLLDGLYEAVAQDTVRSAGAATTLAKWRLWQRLGDQPRNRFVIDQYTLIGDPAMKLRVPEKPELAVNSADLKLTKELLLVSDSTSTLNAKLHNLGLLPQDSVGVQLRLLDEQGKSLPLAEEQLKPFGLEDSLSLTWRLPTEPGAYRLQFDVDPQQVIEEEDESNNSTDKAILVFSSDLTVIKPVNLGVVGTVSPELVINNSRSLSENLVYYFELDTVAAFDSPLLQRSTAIPEGRLVTIWRPKLPVAGIYYWRARTFDGVNYGPWVQASYSYQTDQSEAWLQTARGQFAENRLQDVTAIAPGSVNLTPHQIIYEAQSAGFADGSFVLLVRNNEIFSEVARGHLLVEFDDSDGRLITTRSFDTFKSPEQAEALAQYVNSIPAGHVVLSAIKDEGSANMTEHAYLALESIGSAFTRQVGFRDSWAIIGRKGAAIGSVPEAMKKSGEGAVVVVDTVFRFSKMGWMTSPAIGPAQRWHTAEFSYSANPPNTRVVFNILGKNAATGRVDSLQTNLTGVQHVDLSGVDAKVYPPIQLQAVLFSEEGLNTPALDRWAVDYDPPPDLVIGKDSINLSADTVAVGELVDLNVEVGNFGLSPADSFAIRLFTQSAPAGMLELNRFKVAGIAVDEIKAYNTTLSTQNLSGKVTVNVEVDANAELPELHETNNQFSFEIWVARDTSAPEIRVTFDGRGAGEGEFVSANPEVVVEIRDRGQVVFSDTAQVTIFLDEVKVVYGLAAGQVQLIPQQNPADAQLKALAVFRPTLSEGEHQIEVLAKDPAGNLRYFQVHFLVSSEFGIAEVMNYPNPFQDATEFTYVLTQEADEVRMKLYTIAGRLIKTVGFLPARVGFNHFPWDGRDQDGDALSNGVYLYKIIARKGDRQIEVVEKFVVMR